MGSPQLPIMCRGMRTLQGRDGFCRSDFGRQLLVSSHLQCYIRVIRLASHYSSYY